MRGAQSFNTTNWTLVKNANSGSEENRLQALGELFLIYAPALEDFLKRFYRIPTEQAKEIIQDFVSDRMVSGKLLTQASAEKGRFRTLLLTAIRSFLTDRLRASRTQKRRPEKGFIPLNDLDFEVVGSPHTNEEEIIFNEVFARKLIAEAIRRTHGYCMETEQSDSWNVMFARIIGPLFEDLPKPDYATLTRDLNISSISTARQKLTTAKRIFRREFKAVVAEYTADDREAEEEIAFLKGFLSKNLHHFDD